jgi:hypothetical protein
MSPSRPATESLTERQVFAVPGARPVATRGRAWLCRRSRGVRGRRCRKRGRGRRRCGRGRWHCRARRGQLGGLTAGDDRRVVDRSREPGDGLTADRGRQLARLLVVGRERIVARYHRHTGDGRRPTAYHTARHNLAVGARRHVGGGSRGMRGTQCRGGRDRLRAGHRDLGEPHGRQRDRRDRNGRCGDLELCPDRRRQHHRVRERQREHADQTEPVTLTARSKAAEAERPRATGARRRTSERRPHGPRGDSTSRCEPARRVASLTLPDPFRPRPSGREGSRSNP